MEFRGGKTLFYSCMFSICAALYFIMDNVFRALWFDEALTLSEFMIRNSLPGIYLSYEIPNNHIVFNIFLKTWMSLYERLMGIGDFSFRTFTICCSLAALCAMLIFWRRHAGLMASFLTVLCFIATPAFEIYSVAVRGYILCFLLIIISFESCRRCIKNFSFFNGALFFLFCLLSTGIMPTAIIPLAAVIIYLAPLHNFKKIFTGKFITIALIPPAALILFYLPIANKFLRIFSLQEGWSDKVSALESTYLSFLTGMTPLIIGAAAGLFIALKKYRFTKITLLKIIVIAAIPALVIFAANPAPFPRVFFPLWPLFLFFTAIGLRILLIKARTFSKKAYITVLTLTLISIPLWCAVQKSFAETFSAKFTQNGALDDYFTPYYVNDFNPAKIAAAIKKLSENQNKTLCAYVTFNADPYSVALYGKLYNLPEDFIIYDSPRRKIIIKLTELFLIVAKDEADAAEIKNRLELGELVLLKDCGYQKIFAEKSAAISF